MRHKEVKNMDMGWKLKFIKKHKKIKIQKVVNHHNKALKKIQCSLQHMKASIKTISSMVKENCSRFYHTAKVQIFIKENLRMMKLKILTVVL